MQTVLRPSEMPGLAYGGLNWPYTEGLRMDEANNPLAFLAVGLYGKTLMNQNGAPIRLVVPWKYGFKNVKSIVRIRFVEKMPHTAWNDANPDEYGFYRPHAGSVTIRPPGWVAEPVAEVMWDDVISGQTISNLYGGVYPVVGRDHPRLRVVVYRIQAKWPVPDR
jgi:hypothetical protein